MPLNLNYPQHAFYTMDKPFRAFVGGYRSGKTFLGCVRLCVLALEYPDIRLGYFAPTYPQIRDIFYTTISEVAELLGMVAEVKTSTNEVTLKYYGETHAIIKCRSMEHPQRIVGFDINHALIDEIDCMKKDKADAAWKKIVARLSSSGFDEQRLYDEELDCDLVIEALGENTVDFTTTPEGFNWVYDLFVKQLKEDEELQAFYGIVHASTRQNQKNLPPDYIDKLYATYAKNLVDAYVDGKFVNLTSGCVYTNYERETPTRKTDHNNSIRIVESNDTLHVGMDFNVGKMSAIVHVKDNKNGLDIATVVDEFLGYLDTRAISIAIKNKYPNHKILVYPDASGQNRKSNNAAETDITILREYFIVKNQTRNPYVKDRVNSVQAMLCNAEGLRRYFVNQDKCPKTADSLEQQTYTKTGEPDKSHDNDHPNDALGYFINHEYPIIKPLTKMKFTGF